MPGFVALLWLAFGFHLPRGPEVISPLGAHFYAKPDQKGAVEDAEKKLAADPASVELLIALGRAQVGVLRLHEALATFTRAIALAPGEARLYRLRGHRYISSRQFERGAADLAHAAELSNDQWDIWYHLGLAHYLLRDFAQAAHAYGQARALSTKDDQIIASSNWLYASLRRQKKDAEAAAVLARITPTMKVVEDKMYFALLLFYKGLRTEAEILPEKVTDIEAATIGYGVGNWHLYNGRAERAREVFEKIVRGPEWAAFGFIGAERELTRP